VATQQLLAQNQQLQKEIAQLRQKLAQQNSASLLEKAVQVNGVTVLATTLEAADVETLRQMSDWLRDKLGSAVVVVGAIIGDKPQLVAAVTPDLISRGMHAGNLLREAAKVIGGGGGGRPDMAQAGGKDASKLDAALATVPGWISANLK
jgi:alanyl-tRNA synthetase